MPSMTKVRSEHSLVVVRNKLVVIQHGSNACEVYTTNTGKFGAKESLADLQQVSAGGGKFIRVSEQQGVCVGL